MQISLKNKIEKSENIFLFDKNIDFAKIEKKYKLSKKNLFINLSDNLPNQNKKYEIMNFSWPEFQNSFNDRWIPEKKAIDFVEEKFTKFNLENHSSFIFLKRIYSSKKIILPFKKYLLNLLKEFYKKELIFELVRKQNPNTSLVLDNSEYSEIKKIFNLTKTRHPEIFAKTEIIFIKNKFLEKIKELFKTLAVPLFFILTSRNFYLKKKSFKLAIRLYKNSIDPKEFEWLISKSGVEKSDVIFVIEDRGNPVHIKYLRDNAYNYTLLGFRNAYFSTSFFSLFLKIFFYLPLSFLFFVTLTYSNKIFIREFTNAWLRLLIWKNFLKVYEIKTFISYHHFDREHIYKNILLSHKGIKTYLFKHTHSENIFDENLEKYCNSMFYNQFYDYEFHWSKFSIKMSKSNKSLSKNFEITGPIWSSNYFKDKRNLKLNKQNFNKVISLFPSTFNNSTSVVSVDAHINFFYFIEKIINRFSSDLIILKPKFDINNYKKVQKISKIIDELKEFKNFSIIDSEIPAHYVFSKSDLSISMAFSSTTFEAMCAGKKSFYVDILNNFPNNCYKSLTNFVSNSVDDAIKKTDYWLELGDNEFEKIRKNYLRLMQIENDPKFSIDYINKNISNYLNEKI